MTFQLIRQTNEWTPGGERKNVRREVVGSFDTLGFALAAQHHSDNPKLWAAKKAVSYDVCNLNGEKLFLADLFEGLLPTESFERWATSTEECYGPRRP